MAFAVIEISTLVLAIIIDVVLHVILKNGTQLVVNAVFGILVLIAAKFLYGLNTAITLLTGLVCAIGGILRAFLIIILNCFNLAF